MNNFLGFALVLILVFQTSSIFALSKEEIDKTRINNLHAIADLVERYKSQTGYYPLEKLVNGKDRSVQVKIGHPPITNSTVVVLNAPHVDEVHYSVFEKDLKSVLGEVDIPLDLNKVAFDASNFSIYAVYEGHYFLSCLLNYFHKYARVIDKNLYKYEVTSMPNDGGSWPVNYSGLSVEEKIEILKIIPAPKYSHEDRAFALFQNGDYKGAIKYYNLAIKKEGPTIISYMNLGTAYNRTDQFKLAIESYSRAKDIAVGGEEIAAAHFNRALSYLYLNDIDKALEDVNQAIKHDSEKFRYYYVQGDIYNFKNETDKQLESLNHVIRLNPTDADSLLKRGVIYLENNKIEMATKDFEKAAEAGSKEFKVKLSVAAYFSMYEQKDLAIEYLKMQLDEGLPDAKEILKNERFDKIRESSEFKDILGSLQ